MKTIKLNKILYLGMLIFALGISSFSSRGTKNALAQDNSPNIWRVRIMGADQTGINEPIGLVFSSRLNAFYALDAREWKRSSTFTDLIELTLLEDRADSARVATAITDPINMVYDNKANRLLILQDKANQLLEMPANANGKLDATTLAHHDISNLGFQDPQGMTVNPVSGDLFVLDAGAPRIVRIAGGLDSSTVSTMDLRSSGIAAPRGIAFDPATGHLHILSQSEKKLYELTQTGEVAAVRDLSQFNLKNILGMVFAPSGDQTDEPEEMSLYVTDTSSSTTTQQSDSTAAPTLQSTGQIVEFSLLAPAALPSGTPLLHATLVNLIDTSNASWNPSAPDPSGVDYWPLTGRLLIVDSEVDEMPNYFAGKNVYQSTTSGTLVSTCSTTSFSNEPTGVAINSNNNRIYITDDDANMLHEVSRGSDGIYCTADDGLTTVNVGSVYNIQDAEDVAYGSNTIFIAGGVAAEVYRIPLGPNGILGGGDDGTMTHFDTDALGFSDLEGIGYNEDSNTLFIVSTQGNQNYLGEITTSGTLIRAYDLSFMGTAENIRSDVSYAPSSQNPAIKNIYIASRGVDNNINPNENDGRIWEINIDRQAPEVISVTRANANPTDLSSVNFTVLFSENVTGVGISDFQLTRAGVIGASITNVAGSGNTYTVAVNTGSGDGTIRLDVQDNDSIRDGNNNPLGGWGIGNGNYTSGELYTIAKIDTTGVFRPSNGALYLKNTNATGFADIQINYGLAGDYPVVGDWDGDGMATIGIYRNGTFYLRNSNTIGFADLVFAFGAPGDQPIAGDWDGDGMDTIGVYRSATGTFFLRNSNTPGAPELSFGLGNPGDVGLAGDWDGNGTDTTGVFRPSNGALYLKNQNETGFADIQINYGLPGDQPVTGDWNGDGIDTIGIYRNGSFYLRNSNTIGYADLVFALGINGDMPIAGNWDGLP